MLYVASRQTPVQLDENSLELEKMLDLMHMTATEFKASFGESNWCRALRLYDVADKYGITRFHDVIEDIMAKSVKFTGALRAFFWACEHKSNTVAKAALKQFAHCMSPPDWPEKAGWHPVWCPAPWACGEEFPKMIGIDAYIQYVRACTAAIVEPSATLRTGTNAEAMLRSQVDWRVAATVFDFHYDPKMKRTKSCKWTFGEVQTHITDRLADIVPSVA